MDSENLRCNCTQSLEDGRTKGQAFCPFFPSLWKEKWKQTQADFIHLILGKAIGVLAYVAKLLIKAHSTLTF